MPCVGALWAGRPVPCWGATMGWEADEPPPDPELVCDGLDGAGWLLAAGAGALAAGAGEDAGGAAEACGAPVAAGAVGVAVVEVVPVAAARFGLRVRCGFCALCVTATPTFGGGVDDADGGGSEAAALWPLAPPPRASATTTMRTTPRARVSKNGRDAQTAARRPPGGPFRP